MNSDTARSLDDLVVEASRRRNLLKKEIDSLAQVYEDLYRRSRRPETSKAASQDQRKLEAIAQDTLPAYTSVASSGKRLTSTLLQALRQDSRPERVIEHSKRVAEESWDRKEADTKAREKRAAKLKASQEQPEAVVDYDLDSLYGEG